MASFHQSWSFVLSLLFAATAYAASLQQVTNFGENPSNALMNIWVPDKLAPNPAILVALHGCMQTAQAYYSSTKEYTQAADQRGFIVIYPGANNRERCHDVATTASLTHNGGSDSLAYVNMVKYAIQKYNADPERVFASGSSSGGMMTNVLCAVYPDVFAGGAPISGVPAGCLAGSPGSGPLSADPDCAAGKIIKTPQQWGDQVRSFYPGYNGTYPRVQVWHGTSDRLVTYPNLEETLKQWSNIHGVQLTEQVPNTPQRSYTKLIYGDGTKLVGYSAQGVGHTVPVHPVQILEFFGL
ncbi:PHB depolymerase family esterase [Eremomyces bilateralis CBS 781.70]|uniref:Carboxylic ester hydrolase n=1 Tax=Eremomyces bilateralis CBS 781.70 TaxID=1392243 RepID=A0A6G1FTP4_9PEZI|nr:PHB depolymerase family esterase [Eremomyces bilateralis CBS 781.70]KAF1809110.1 PHB depolymerase family esterase [Eremomyces bilateralis CBS 781.70]